MEGQKAHQLSYRELKRHHRALILELSHTRPKKEVRDALAQLGIDAKPRAVRMVLDHDLNIRKARHRDLVKRMYGIYEKWENRNIKVAYNGHVQTKANLKASLLRKRKKDALTEYDLPSLKSYSGPTPKEIFYFDEDDRSADLLALDGCLWKADEREEAMRSIAELHSGTRPYERIRATSSQERPEVALSERDAQTFTAPRVMRGYGSAANDTPTPVTKDRSRSSSGHPLDGFLESSLIIDSLLNNDELDRAFQLAIHQVESTRETFGESSSLHSTALVSLASVISKKGQHYRAYQMLEPLIQAIEAQDWHYNNEALLAMCRLSEVVLEAGESKRAKSLCCSVFEKSVLGSGIAANSHMMLKVQLAKICNTREEYAEAKELLYEDARWLLESIQSDEYASELQFARDEDLRSLIQLMASLQGLGSWEAVSLSAVLDREFTRRRYINIMPRKMWNLELILRIGILQYSLGAYHESEIAFRHYRDALSRTIPSDGHRRIIAADCWIANSLYYQDKPKAAMAIYDILILRSCITWGPHHSETLTLRSNRTWASEKIVLVEEFKKSTREIYELRVTHLGEVHRDTEDSKRFCADVAAQQGRWEESWRLLEEIYGTLKRGRAAHDHSRLLEILLARGRMLADKGDYSRAVEVLKEALEVGCRLPEPSHPDAFAALIPLSAALSASAREAEAEEVLINAIDKLTGALGQKHYRVTSAEQELAIIYSRQDNVAAAIDLQRRVLEKRISMYTVHHPYVITSTKVLADLYLRQNNPVKAQDLLESAIKSFRLIPDMSQQSEWILNTSLSRMLLDNGETKKAWDAAQKAQLALKTFYRNTASADTNATPDAYDLHWIPTLNQLASTQWQLGSSTDCIELLETVVHVHTKYYGSDHPITLSSVSNLASKYDNCGDILKAEQMCRQNVDTSSRVLGPWDRRTVEYKIDYCSILIEKENFAECQGILMSLLQWIFDNERMKRCAVIARIYKMLACLYGRKRKFNDAKRFQRLALLEYTTQSDVGSILTMIDLTQCYILLEKPSLAVAEAANVVRLAKQAFGSQDTLVLSARRVQAQALHAAGDHDECGSVTRALLMDIESAQGANSSALMRLEKLHGESLLAQERVADAEYFLEQCVYRSGRNDIRNRPLIELHRLLAQVKGHRRKFNEMETILKELSDNLTAVMPRSPAHYEATLDYAELRVTGKTHTAALVLIDEAMETIHRYWGDHSVETFEAKARLLNALSKDDLEEHFRTLTLLSEQYAVLLTANPEVQAKFWRTLADTYRDLGFSGEIYCRLMVINSSSMMEQANQEDVRDIQDMAWRLFGSGDWAKAEAVLDKLTSMSSPSDPSDLACSLHLLGMAKEKLGKVDEAERALEQSLQAAAQNPDEEPKYNLMRLDHLVDIRIDSGKWRDAEAALVEFVILKAEVPEADWPHPIDETRMDRIAAALQAVTLDDGEVVGAV